MEVVGGDLRLWRGRQLILRGRLDLGTGAPRIAEEPNGWRIEHPAGQAVADEFELAVSGHWYGGQELLNQRWPLERLMIDESPLITSDSGPEGWSCILSPLWLASRGVAILADDEQKLTVGLNSSMAGRMTFEWDLDVPPPFDQRPRPDDGTGNGRLRLEGDGLRYRILTGDNAVEAWRMSAAYMGHPAAVPPESLWRAPIWTTWARHKTEISQARVLEFADEIIAHGFSHGVLEIDDRWQTHYGDLEFDPDRFPDPQGMIDALHARGFAVTAWVMPFLAPDAHDYAIAASRGYLLRAADGSVAPVRWWQGDGALLDVADEGACEWFAGRLRALQAAVGLDGFKFDAGEAIFARRDNEYTRRYVKLAANWPFCEVRSGWGNQTAPVLFRQWDKSSTWGFDNGLASVITGAFAIGLAGYPFVLPDMVGGNNYRGEIADAELMVRWTQASVFFPAIQFSLPPWDYGEECERSCRAALELREQYMPRIVQAMRRAAETGEPPIRPLWWAAPDDERGQTCSDEYMLGDDILVAPVLQPGQRSRSVYLPPGAWRPSGSNRPISGPAMLDDVPAPLETLLLFERT